MDIYLPSDFYQLRDNLPDWRDADATHYEAGASRSVEAPREDSADPLWQAI